MSAEEIAKLPPSALVIFALATAVLFAVRYFGFNFGKTTPPQKSQTTAPVAAMIVDNTALIAATAAIEALNVTLIEYSMLTRKLIEGDANMTDELEELRQELRLGRELMAMLRRLSP